MAYRRSVRDQDYYDFMATWHQEYGLSVRLCNCLWHMGISSLEEVAGKSDIELLRQENLGWKSVKELRQFLSTRRIVPRIPLDTLPEGVISLYLTETLLGKITHFAKTNDRDIVDEVQALLNLAVREIGSINKYLK